MRGKVEEFRRFGDQLRITPAYAGKRYWYRHRRFRQQDHPRLCGEKHDCVALPACLYGSPPPMRGKARPSTSCKAALRITPAYAGKSDYSRFAGDAKGDHPRLCGEKGTALAQSEHVRGSPPPMRGKVTARNVIIPDPEDHPRLCGEKIAKPLVYLIVTGSPPPMRGKVCEPNAVLHEIGITPAYAGKSINQ